MKIVKNPNTEKAEKIAQAVKNNDGYCPCLIERNEDTRCMCKEFLERNSTGECRCGLFVKVEL